MALLGLITLASSFSSISAQVDPLLFSEECCSEKTVGGAKYKQVPGETAGYDCVKDCVYEDEANPGSRTCFKTGGAAPQPASCDESVLDSQYLDVIKKGNEVHFETNIGTFCCTLAGQASSESSQCTMNEDRNTTGFSAYEEGAFFSSRSSLGKLEWMSLNTPLDFIHCDFSNSLPSSCTFVQQTQLPSETSATDSPALSVDDCDNPSVGPLLDGPTIRMTDAIYVLDAQDAEGDGNVAQRTKCSDRCSICNCKFWTLSFDANTPPSHSDTHRNHNDKSECGLRYYEPNIKLKTNKAQYAGKNGDPLGEEGFTYVFDKFSGYTQQQCNSKCVNTSGCTNWTWEKDTYSCAINTYKPSRLINIRRFRPTPNIVSGCLLKACTNLKAIG